jgi:hypothetical protein
LPIFKISSDGSAVEEFHEHDKSEEELRTLFERHGLRFVEKNLRFVDRNVPAGHGFIDTLAIDEAKRPTIIEYKVDKDASPNALVQALSYAYHLDKDQEYFAKYISKKLGDVSDDDMDFDNIRIVLVAPGFESHVEEAARLVDPQVKLVKYSIYRAAGSDALSTSIVFDSISTRVPNTLRSDYTLEDHFSGRYASMKTTFLSIMFRCEV